MDREDIDYLVQLLEKIVALLEHNHARQDKVKQEEVSPPPGRTS